MKRLTALLGDDQELFGLFVGDLGFASAVGLVLILTDAIARSRVWTRVVAASADEGIPCLIFEAPGVGLNGAAGTHELAPAIEEACTALRSRGADKVAIATTAEAALPVLEAAALREDVVGVMTVGLPEVDVIERLATNTPASEYLRRGLRLSSLRGLFERERRRRYRELVMAKIANAFTRRRASGEPVSLDGLGRQGAVGEIVTALDSGTRVMVLAGHDDKGLRLVRGLQDRAVAGGLSGLQVDSSFPGRLARLDTVASHDWIVDVSLRWLDSLAPSQTPVQSPLPSGSRLSR